MLDEKKCCSTWGPEMCTNVINVSSIEKPHIIHRCISGAYYIVYTFDVHTCNNSVFWFPSNSTLSEIPFQILGDNE